MSLIEGIGDEVTVLATCLLLLAIVIVAWTFSHVDVRTHNSVVTIDREHFGELFRRVRDITVHFLFADDTDVDIQSLSSASAAEAHSAGDSLLVSGAAANDIKPEGLHDVDVDNHQSSDGEQKCLHESEAATGSSLKCESASTSESNTNCSESALSFLSAATTAVTGNTPPNSIQVRLQFVDGRQKAVFANPDDTIGHFKRYDCSYIL